MMHWGNFGELGFGGFHLGWIFMVLFWALVIVGAAYLLKQLFSGNDTVVAGESAEDVLRKRFAAGEITKEEYSDNLKIIRRH